MSKGDLKYSNLFVNFRISLIHHRCTIIHNIAANLHVLGVKCNWKPYRAVKRYLQVLPIL